MLPVKSVTASIFVLKAADEVTQLLLLRRRGYLAGLWSQIAGEIKAGETAWQTAIRAVYEATGIALTEIWSTDIIEQFYEADKECITLVPVFVSGVPADTAVRLNSAHDACEWDSFEDAKRMLSFPAQRKALAAVKAEFVDRAPSPHLRIDMNGEGCP